MCLCTSRVFVQRGIYDEFVRQFVAQAKAMKIGDPFDEDTTVGATISKDHAEKVLGFIDRARQDGVKVECGGERVILSGATKHLVMKCISNTTI